jgi:PIN domain
MKGLMFKILVDTCVWLDLAKDARQRALLGVLEELVREGRIALVVPRIVLDEFARNKARVAAESGRSISDVLKRVREVVDRLGDQRGKRIALRQLADVGHRIPLLGEAAIESIGRIETLLASAPVVETSSDVKVRAADRAVAGRAPFHRNKNSVADAILIETYADLVRGKGSSGVRFAFVTHNTKDFSHPTGSDALPHPDIAACFSKVKSLYFTSLGAALRRVEPNLVSDRMLEEEWEQEPRRLSEILAALEELLDKVWYNRHQNSRIQIERGQIKLVEKETFPVRNHAERPIQRDVWEMAQKAAKRVERTYGAENLGPWDDFEWGMLNGKLSALRWTLGDEWDNLET